MVGAEPRQRAQGLRYSGDIDAIAGEEAQRASYLNAASTIAGGGASIMRMYGPRRIPSSTDSLGNSSIGNPLQPGALY